jgi:hypothetical protein
MAMLVAIVALLVAALLPGITYAYVLAGFPQPTDDK